MRKPNAGVYPPELDLSSLPARLGYIASHLELVRGSHSKEYAATVREAIDLIEEIKAEEDYMDRFLSDFDFPEEEEQRD